ncbi:MAG: hypothetical protein AAGJ37_11050 [Pseudomonadota bacterium]
MRKLSQRAWNNILIFSMLALIIILNWENFVSRDVQTSSTALDQTDVILSMQIDTLSFERIGTGWRVQGPEHLIPKNLNTEKIDQIVNSWLQLQLSELSSKAEYQYFTQPDHNVKLYVAGRQEPLLIYLVLSDNQLYAMIENQPFIIEAPLYTDLIPGS